MSKVTNPASGSSDLAGRPYWDQVWKRASTRPAGRFSYFHYCFARVLLAQVRLGMSACEVGCADSVWIPFLVERGVTVVGIDYSDYGLSRLQENLRQRGLAAELIKGDLFDPTLVRGKRFDVVFSLGLVEHFDDGVVAAKALANLVKPGGTLITLVPNLVGPWGAIQKQLDRSVYDVHLRYRPETLDDVHVRAGMQPIEHARYFGGFGPLVMNAPRVADAYPRLHRAVVAIVWVVQQVAAWTMGVALGRRTESRGLSSHILGIYRQRE